MFNSDWGSGRRWSLKFEQGLDKWVGVPQAGEAGERWLCGGEEMRHRRQQEGHRVENIVHWGHGDYSQVAEKQVSWKLLQEAHLWPDYYMVWKEGEGPQNAFRMGRQDQPQSSAEGGPPFRGSGTANRHGGVRRSGLMCRARLLCS